jgi:hypothetical protein
MTNLFKSTVADSQFRADGIAYFTQHGEPMTVNGTPMVRLSHGVLVPAKGWHSEHSDAVREAAQRIEDLGHRLLAQADRLRAEAAVKEEVTT